MKLKIILLAIGCLAVVIATQAQLLKKLQKKVEQAAERTVLNKTGEIVSKKTEKTIDDITQGNNEDKNTGSQVENTVQYANPSLALNAIQSNWIDQDTGNTQTSFHDSEDYFMTFNETEKRYNETGLLAMEGMNMMVPSMKEINFN